jgi:hypothetical protein
LEAAFGRGPLEAAFGRGPRARTSLSGEARGHAVTSVTGVAILTASAAGVDVDVAVASAAATGESAVLQVRLSGQTLRPVLRILFFGIGRFSGAASLRGDGGCRSHENGDDGRGVCRCRRSLTIRLFRSSMKPALASGTRKNSCEAVPRDGGVGRGEVGSLGPRLCKRHHWPRRLHFG